jgi:hypothetical protein
LNTFLIRSPPPVAFLLFFLVLEFEYNWLNNDARHEYDSGVEAAVTCQGSGMVLMLIILS